MAASTRARFVYPDAFCQSGRARRCAEDGGRAGSVRSYGRNWV